MNKVTGFNESRKYIGEYTDATNLDYLNARYYDGYRGNFISEDPTFWGNQNLSDPQSLNSYSYGNDSPIVKKDPLGLAGMGFLEQLQFANNQSNGILGQMIQNQSAGYAKGANTIGNAVATVADYTPVGSAYTAFTGKTLTGVNVGPLGQAIAVLGIVPGEGAISRGVIKAGDTVAGLKVTKHAADNFAIRHVTVQQVENALSNGTKYLDKKKDNLVHVVGERGRGGYTIVTDFAQKVLVTVQNFVQKLPGSRYQKIENKK